MIELSVKNPLSVYHAVAQYKCSNYDIRTREEWIFYLGPNVFEKWLTSIVNRNLCPLLLELKVIVPGELIEVYCSWGYIVITRAKFIIISSKCRQIQSMSILQLFQLGQDYGNWVNILGVGEQIVVNLIFITPNTLCN